MWHIGMMGLSALFAGLLTPMVWLLVRVSGLLPFLVEAVSLRLFPLHLLAGAWGCLLGLVMMRIMATYTGTGSRRTISWILGLLGGFGGGAISSLIFFPLVALF